MSDSFPVTVEVRRADGSNEFVRVGTATKSAAGFNISFMPMVIQTSGELVSAGPAPRAASSGGGGGGDGMIFPPYGRSKGQPVRGASMNDLEFYKNGCLRTLNDPGKARWHDKERVLLAAIDAEISRQGGGGGGAPDDDGIPPPGDEDAPF